MLRIALSIKAGRIRPSMILRRLNIYSRKNRLYFAFRELGRVVRTIFLLNYLSSLACCTEEEEAREPPSQAVDQATRTESGRSRSSIRLRTWAAMATSVARASSLWKRSPSPMTCFQRANWPSTRALSL